MVTLDKIQAASLWLVNRSNHLVDLIRLQLIPIVTRYPCVMMVDYAGYWMHDYCHLLNVLTLIMVRRQQPRLLVLLQHVAVHYLHCWLQMQRCSSQLQMMLITNVMITIMMALMICYCLVYVMLEMASPHYQQVIRPNDNWLQVEVQWIRFEVDPPLRLAYSYNHSYHVLYIDHDHQPLLGQLMPL